MHLFGESSYDFCTKLQKAASTQDADRSHQADEGRKDLDDSFHALFGSNNKVIIYICFHKQAISEDC